MNEQDEFIEPDIVMGLITSTEFLHRVRPIFKREYIEANYPAIVADWVFEYDDTHGQAPGRNIEGVFRDKLTTQAIRDKGLVENIEEMLTRVSKEYEKGNAPPNYDYLFTRTRKYFDYRRIANAAREAEKQAIAGDTEAAYQTMREGSTPIATGDERPRRRAGQAWADPLPEGTWLIPSVLPTGLTVLGGQSKVGKSQLLLNLALALTRGRPAFDEFAPPTYSPRQGGGPHRVRSLLLSLEDPQSRLEQRMREIDPDPDLELVERDAATGDTLWDIDLYLHTFHDWPPLVKGGLQKIDEWLDAQGPALKLVIIDTIAKVWNKKAGTGGGGLYAEERAIFAPLGDLARRHANSGIILAHHATKARDPANPFNQILGGAGTYADADTLMLLEDHPHVAGQKRLLIRGKDVGEQALAFEVDGYHWHYAGEARAVQKTAQRQALYDLMIEAGEPLTQQQIKEEIRKRELDIKASSVATVLEKMVQEGSLEHPAYGQYAPKGYRQRQTDLGISERISRNRRNDA